MAPGAGINGIFSATYSGVPVFEYNIEGNHVMRRRHDSYINATHILKVAEYDKPARTRILEREVQKGIHEKIQGGYGKYQGTWVPLKDGRQLAERNGVLEKLRPIFDYVAGDISPPQAPKHTTNSNKPREKKQNNGKKIQKNQNYSQRSEDYDNVSNQHHEDGSFGLSSPVSTSFMDEDDPYAAGHHPYGPAASRKRKRGQEIVDQEHTFFADQLLDYFMLSASEAPYGVTPPRVPDSFLIDRPIDDQSHTALHWGVAMGDIDIVRSFLERGANTRARNQRGETPLIRAVLFTNNFEKDTMLNLVHQLLETIQEVDNYGASILHHIAMTTSSLAKKKCARYYLDVVLNKAGECLAPKNFSNFINYRDRNGDTALHIAARHNAKKCIRALQGRGVRGDIYNESGETADHILHKTRSTNNDFISSSPPLPSAKPLNNLEVMKPNAAGHYHSHSARSFSQSFGSMAQDKGLQVALAFDSEVREKDDDLSESERLRQQIEDERRQVHELYLRYMAEDDDLNEEEIQLFRDEERKLVAESKSLSEQIQHRDLHHAVRSEEHSLPPSAHQKTNGVVISDEVGIEEQGVAALGLASEQSRRRILTNTIVAAESAAGMSPHGEKLKQLVSQTCGVPAEDVPSLAPELLDELQQSKMEVGSEAAIFA